MTTKTDKRLEREQIMYDALRRIAKEYQTPEKLRRNAERQYGLEYEEALEMTYPEWGTALIECANPPCKWRGYETEMIPDPSPDAQARSGLIGIEHVCPQCKKAGYYFVEEQDD